MIVEGDFAFDGPREAVWKLLLDPQVLSKALPGSRGLEETGEGRYEGRMNVSVGPVTAAEFTVSVTLSDLVEPESYTMVVDGKGPIGFTKGKASVRLVDADGGTTMTYRADLQVGGKIAGVGQRLLDSVSRTMTRQGLASLNDELKARLAPVNDVTTPAAGTGATGAGAVTTTGSKGLLRAVGVVVILLSLFLLCGPGR